MSDHLIPKQPQPTGSRGKAAVGGVTIFVLLRLLAELAGFTGPARNFSRVIHGAEDLAGISRAARSIDELDEITRNTGRMAEKVFDDVRDLKDIKRTGRDVGKYDDVPVGLLGEGNSAKGIVTSHISSLDDEEVFFQRTIGFLQDYPVDNKDIWAPLLPDETIRRSILIHSASKEPPANYKVLSIIPNSDEAFENMFKTSWTAGAKKEMEKYGPRFEALDHSLDHSKVKVAASSNYGKSELFKYIKDNSEANPIIIVGHSEEVNAGRSLILPNGEKVSIDAIHKTCLSANSRCLILSCYSDDFRLSGQISMRDAYFMTRRGVETLELIRTRPDLLPTHIKAALANESMTKTELMIEAMRAERNIRRAGKIAIYTVLVASGVGVTYEIISTYDDGKTK